MKLLQPIVMFVLLIATILTLMSFYKYSYNRGKEDLEDKFIKAIMHNDSTVIGPFIIVKDVDRHNMIYLENPKFYSNKIEYYK